MPVAMKIKNYLLTYALIMPAVFCAAPAPAAVFLDLEHNAIVMTDYPPAAPCSLARLAAVDRAFGWGRVVYDSVSNTCVITGDLVIGANDGTESVLQVGSADRLRETLIMRGNLYIHPYFIRGANPGKYWQAPKKMNALVLGDRTNGAVNAALLFDCAPTNRRMFSCGHLPWAVFDAEWGGGLYVYNSRIAPLNPAPGHAIGDGNVGIYLMGSTVFENADISGVNGMLYRMGPGINKDYSIKDTTFERVATPLAGGHQKMQGCRFIACGTAVLDRGSIDAELTDCVFRGNARNWSLTYSDKGLTCIDCVWDEPGRGDVYGIWTNAAGKIQRPKFTCRRHVVVAVADASGKPVAGATVSFKPEQPGCDLLLTRTCATGPDGRTPGKGQAGPMQLTEYIKTATDMPDRPDMQAFTYVITAEQKGRRASIAGFVPDQSWKIANLILPGE